MGKGGKKARRVERPESEICELLVRAEAEGRGPVAAACRERAERLAGKLAVAGAEGPGAGLPEGRRGDAAGGGRERPARKADLAGGAAMAGFSAASVAALSGLVAGVGAGWAAAAAFCASILAAWACVVRGREGCSLEIFPPSQAAAWTIGALVLMIAENWLCAGCEPVEPFPDLLLAPLSWVGWAAAVAIYAMEAGWAFAAWMEDWTEGGR